MKKILYFLLASLCISLQSCLYQEDSYFDDSSANRATEDVERCNELLMNAPNGWKLEYYAGKNYSMGGITLLCQFDGKNVKIMSEIGSLNAKPGAEATSLYKVVSEQSTLLTFDTFNELIHCFSEPILKQNSNFQGDYEFAIMSASENEIILQGKKYQNKMVMTPMPADTDWSTYINDLNKIADEAFLNTYILNIAVRLNSTTIKIVCSTADFPRSSIFFSFPSPPNQKVMDLEVTPRRISTPFPSPFQDY